MRRARRVLLLRLHGARVAQVGHPRNARPPYPLKYIEALLEREGRFVSRLLDGLIEPLDMSALLAEVLVWEPDVLVVQATTLDLRELREFTVGLASSARPPGLVIGVGQALLAPERPGGSLPGIDLLVQGEPEEFVLKLILGFDRGLTIQELREEIPPEPMVVPDPNLLPHPRFSARELGAYRMHYPLRVPLRVRWGHILSSRGCPNQCLFCSPVTRESYGHRLRVRDPDDVLAEIEGLVRQGANLICFDDDNLSASREHLGALCEGIAARHLGLGWICHARLDDLDEPMIALLARSGCRLLRFGVEAASAEVLRTLRKTRIPDWEARARRVFAACREQGIGTTALLLLGNPGETLEEARQTLRLARDLRPDLVQFHYFTPYPGSPAFELYKDRIPEDQVPLLYHYDAPPLNLSQMSDEQLAAIYRSAYLGFLGRPAFLVEHLRTYLPFYLRNPGLLWESLPFSLPGR